MRKCGEEVELVVVLFDESGAAHGLPIDSNGFGAVALKVAQCITDDLVEFVAINPVEQLPKGAGTGDIEGVATVPTTRDPPLRLGQTGGEIGDGLVALGSGEYGACGDGKQAGKRVAPSAHGSQVGHGAEAFE